MSFDEAGVDLVLDVKIVREDVQAHGNRGFNRLYYKLAQRPLHSRYSFCTRPLMNDHLADH